jgi:hypothetical protein
VCTWERFDESNLTKWIGALSFEEPIANGTEEKIERSNMRGIFINTDN